MQIYHYHPESLEYVGEGVADESPLEPGVWLIPANATSVQPPDSCEGFRRLFCGGEWLQVAIPPPPPPETAPAKRLYYSKKRLINAICGSFPQLAGIAAQKIAEDPIISLRFVCEDLFAPDDQDFSRAINAVVAAAGLNLEQREQILKAAEELL